ncbi:Fc.00g107680.m01.CDS01 [Cosmosporella sp. VM-42]
MSHQGDSPRARSPKSPSKSPPKSPSDHAPGSPLIEAVAGLDQDDSDADSAVGSGSLASSTTSLSESILDYRRLHGRTYENIKTTEYWAPNDDQQNEGLDIIHNGLLMLLNDELYLAPIGRPARVLDIGTGTGIWAMDFGDKHPETEVIGTDLSPIQPAWVAPNVQFMIDDCLLDWTWEPNHFDFIHIRALYGSIPDWRDLYKKAFKHLKPGGWAQDLEMDVRIVSDHVDIPDDHVFNRWADLFYQGGEKMGRTFACSVGHTMRDNMEAAGFVDIVEKKIKTPIHGWPKDPKLQQAGLLFQLALEESIEGFGMFLLTQILGWQQEEVIVLLSQMRKELKKKSYYGYVMTTVVYGRRPDEEPAVQH